MGGWRIRSIIICHSPRTHSTATTAVTYVTAQFLVFTYEEMKGHATWRLRMPGHWLDQQGERNRYVVHAHVHMIHQHLMVLKLHRMTVAWSSYLLRRQLHEHSKTELHLSHA